ncbi:hypothetical protein ES288_D13G187800v1 [Gossypium darwinii]|uniref:Uncharacterized protein n=2 Tax=Gossypium TaxID=3633 RepID=A0A5D2A2Z3_GOSDA|nr:hypothetical protein ES288_D13G187800v1 [Gossypium darwinii]
MALFMPNSSFVACFTALVSNLKMGNSAIAGSIFSGYFIAQHKMPSYCIFIRYTSLFVQVIEII